MNEVMIKRKMFGWFIDGILIFLLLLGIAFRFLWVDWNEGTQLHPDEYGLTNTLTQLHLPRNLHEYFNTRQSPLSPYNTYDEFGQLVANGPDNRMRWGQWPMIIIRVAAEITDNTGYNQLCIVGRRLSALADALSVGILLLIGMRLYGKRIGLLAGTLSALAVLQIQQSHFMTVDNFGVLFVMLAMYACVRISQKPGTRRLKQVTSGSYSAISSYQPDYRVLVWYVLFGVFWGMGVASKVNLLPLGGMVFVAAFIGIADLKLKTRDDLWRIIRIVILYLGISCFAAFVTFRFTQPMSFRAPTGNTTLFTLHPNKDWVDSMKVARSESGGIGGGPPSEQWAHRPAIIFPLMNMLLWGMGLPLGIAGWAGIAWAATQLANGKNWRVHLLPVVWTGGYFLFMGTRWVKSIRYFLPIYPFLSLFASWLLVEFYRYRTAKKAPQANKFAVSVWDVVPALLFIIVTLGTLIWTIAFTNAVYGHEHTRIRATRWIFENIPGPFQLTITDANGIAHHEQIPAPDGVQVTSAFPFVQLFRTSASGTLTAITIPRASILGKGSELHVSVASDSEGRFVIDKTAIPVPPSLSGVEVQAAFHNVEVQAGKDYYLLVTTSGESPITIHRMVIANESWDEGLPLPLDGWNPFGQLYRGIAMEVRWYDDEHKRQMFLDTLSQADYVILPSQRAIWSTCRLPRTYPMTMQYYRALFNGQLGFDLVALFTAPLQLGPVSISDVGGTLAWKRTPDLPLFNHNFFAAEEAFSVYDHPPVWIFKKRADFNSEAVERVLDSVDLTTVVVQSPREATGDLCP